MKFYNWLNEGATKQISHEDFNSYINNDFKEAYERYQKGYYIWRGTKNYGDHAISIPKEGRKSRYSKWNYYTLIINNHKSWKEFPKRQVICSGGSGIRAQFHGSERVYMVLPENGAKIGICPKDDIWGSFDSLYELGIDNMNMFNDLISILKISDENWQSFRKESKGITFSDVIEALENLPFIPSRLIKYFKNNKYKTLYDWAVTEMNPQDNGFDIQKISNYDVNKSNDVEVWTDARCLLIDNDLLKNIIKGM